MSAMMDARCPKCGCRIGWQGKAIDRPPCPKCRHQVDRAELEATDRQLGHIVEMLGENVKLPKHLYTPAEIFKAKAQGCEPEMLLPEGKTCHDCQSCETCRWLLGESFHDDAQHCDWAPSRFFDAWRPRRTA